MLKMVASLFVVLAASILYLQAAQPGGLCAMVDHPHMCGDKPLWVKDPGVAAAD